VHGTSFSRGGMPFPIIVLFLVMLTGCATTPMKADMDTLASDEEVSLRLDLAESYLVAGEPRRTLKELLVIESQARTISRYHNLIGHTYLRLGEYEKAEQSFAQTVQLEPEFAEAYVSLGIAQISQGKGEPAEKSFKEALSILTYLTPEYAAYNLALLYRSQGKTTEAVEYARIAVEKNWRYIPGYLLLSDLLNRQGKTRDAISLLQQGSEADLNNVQISLRLAESLLRVGDIDEAKRWFRQVIETSPDSEEAKVANEYLEML
jgi:type IV pilus assembly protein PilF